MSLPVFQIRSFITYWLNAVDAHSLHSPFFYDFYTRVIHPGRHASGFTGNDSLQAYRQIEHARLSLLKNKSSIEVVDLGAGSRHAEGPRRKISEIASHSLSNARYGQLYHRAVAHYQAEYVLELGTSLGINTMYLATHPGTHVTTIEGSPEVANVAKSLFAQQQAGNIDVVCGNIDDVLTQTVIKIPRIDFAFLDANHRRDPTLRYFDAILSRIHPRSVVVLDDIHNNAEMNKAWNEIKHHPRTTATADLFRCGFVFFEPSLNSQHFVLQI